MNVLILLSRLSGPPGSTVGERGGSLLRALRGAGVRSHVMALRRGGGGDEEASASACRELAASLETFSLPWSGPLLGALELARGGSYCMRRHRHGELRRRCEEVMERERCAAVICVGLEMTPHVPPRPPFYVLDLAERASQDAAERARSAPPPRRFWHMAEAAALRDIEAEEVHRAHLALVADPGEADALAYRNPRRQVLCVPMRPKEGDWHPIIDLIHAAGRDTGRPYPMEASPRRAAARLPDL